MVDRILKLSLLNSNEIGSTTSVLLSDMLLSELIPEEPGSEVGNIEYSSRIDWEKLKGAMLSNLPGQSGYRLDRSSQKIVTD